eukprot:21698-Eustigmatos_ZCMA.PRE.1
MYASYYMRKFDITHMHRQTDRQTDTNNQKSTGAGSTYDRRVIVYASVWPMLQRTCQRLPDAVLSAIRSAMLPIPSPHRPPLPP